MRSLGLGQAPVHPQLMELLLTIQKLLANLLFHRFNLMGKMRGGIGLQAHKISEAKVALSTSDREGPRRTCSWVQDGRSTNIWLLQQEVYRWEGKKKEKTCWYQVYCQL